MRIAVTLINPQYYKNGAGGNNCRPPKTTIYTVLSTDYPIEQFALVVLFKKIFYIGALAFCYAE